jgi:hypothetical protein
MNVVLVSFGNSFDDEPQLDPLQMNFGENRRIGSFESDRQVGCLESNVGIALNLLFVTRRQFAPGSSLLCKQGRMNV